MTQQIINVGTGPDSYTGESLRTAFQKVNDNFSQLYAGNVGANISGNIITANGFVTSGNVVAGNVTAAGNISAYYFTGDGSQLTGVTVSANTGNISFSNLTISGSVAGNIVLDPAGDGNVSIVSDVIPGANVTYNLGSSTRQWKDLWLSNSTLYLGGFPVTVSNTGALSVNGSPVTSSYGNANVTVFLPTYSGLLGGTLSTVSQPNITAVGTLTSLTATNDITVNSGRFIGNGSGLTAITGANVNGTVANATYAVTAQFVTGLTGANVTTALGYVPLNSNSANTYSNTNVASYLPTYTGNIAGNISKNGNVWIFGTTGTTTFPTNISVDYSGNNVQFPRIIADSGKAFSIQGQGNIGSAALSWTVDPNSASQYAAVSVSRGGGDNLAKVILQAQSDSGDVATAKTWQFNQTGTTRFPGDIILAPAGTSITMQSDQYSQLMWENANVTVAPNMAINSNFYVAQNNATLDIVYRDGNSTQQQKSWLWGVDGTLTLPTAGRINFDYLSISSDANVSAFYAPAGNVQLAAGTGNAQIVANSLNDSKTWIFGTDGNLALPAGGVLLVSGGITAGPTIASPAPYLSGFSSISAVSMSASGNISSGNMSTGVITLTNGAVIKDNAGDSVAFGQSAGATSQGNSAVAIGHNAGVTSQGTFTVAIGRNAGQTSQGGSSVAVGVSAGDVSQGTQAVAVGNGAGGGNQGNSAVAIGVGAGQSTQGIEAVAIGNSAGSLTQGISAIAIGKGAGRNFQGNNSIIINATGADLNQTTANTFTVAPVRNDVANVAEILFYNTTSKEVTYGNTISVAGNITGGNISTGVITLINGAVIRDTAGDAVAFGENAGLTSQGNYGVAIGTASGQTSQGINSVAVGVSAGFSSQGAGAVAVGGVAGSVSQGAGASAFGPYAGFTNQGVNAVAVGQYAGYVGQGTLTVAVGYLAGNSSQGNNAVAIGNESGRTTQGGSAVAVGTYAGSITQGLDAVAVGDTAGYNTQGNNAIAIGASAGTNTQGKSSVAIGQIAGRDAQGNNSVALGFAAGYNTQGANAVAIGSNAGTLNQANNSIIINATGNALEQTTANTFTVSPVRNDVSNVAQVVFYNTTSKEITYGNTISVAGNISAGNLNVTGNIVDTGALSIITGSNGNIALIPNGTGIVTVSNALTVAGNITGNTGGFAIGYRDIPQVVFTSNATLALTDAGKHYFSSNSANIITVPNNTTVSFNIGTAISIVQQGTANLTVTPGSGVTMYLAGNSTSSSRTLGNYGMATLMKVDTNTWFINGTGVN